MGVIVTLVLLAAAVVHLLPAIGAMGADRLSRLYGVTIADPSVALMMRQRAVLFGVIGAFLLAAAFRPNWHTLGSSPAW